MPCFTSEDIEPNRLCQNSNSRMALTLDVREVTCSNCLEMLGIQEPGRSMSPNYDGSTDNRDRRMFDYFRKRLGIPKIICMCGSTRFTNQMLIAKWEYERDGSTIVLAWNSFPPSYCPEKTNIAESQGYKESIDDLHKRKIDLCDEVLVLNINNYIGESTRSEINYAESINKPIRYLVPESTPELEGDK